MEFTAGRSLHDKRAFEINQKRRKTKRGRYEVSMLDRTVMCLDKSHDDFENLESTKAAIVIYTMNSPKLMHCA